MSKGDSLQRRANFHENTAKWHLPMSCGMHIFILFCIHAYFYFYKACLHFIRDFFSISTRNHLSRLTTKPSKWHVRPAKTQIQPGHPPSLIRVFAVRMKKALSP